MSNNPTITLEEVGKIAKLARLELSSAEMAKYSQQLSAILGYIKQLSEVDTESVRATHQVTGLSNIMREDVVSTSSDAKELVNMAPGSENNLIKVKAVFE